MSIIDQCEERKRQIEKDLSDMATAPDFQPVKDRIRAAAEAYGELIDSLRRTGIAKSAIHPSRAIHK
jgi:hypothetical protein